MKLTKFLASTARAGSLLALALATGIGAQTQSADTYPDKPIRMVVPYPPGGPTDLVARLAAAEMSTTLGQPIVVDNKPGASGMLGAEMVARASADGYTFLANASLHVINPFIYSEMRFDALNDFVPITQLAAVPLVLVVPADSNIRSVQDLVAAGKANPGALNFASAGNASAQQLAGESFKMAAGIDMQHVPYKGSAPALVDLIGGQVQLMFDSMPSAMPHVQSGKLRALAVTTPKRVPALPNVPTIAESGFPGYDISTWYGLWAPKDTPQPIVDKLYQAAAAALKTPKLVEQYSGMGAEPVGSTPANFKRYNASEGLKWGEIVRKSGAKGG